jgi:hypothetical protein
LVRGEETGNAASLDLGKLQNLFFTVALLIAYAANLRGTLTVADTGAFAGLPELSEGLVSLLGISHAGYLTYKAVPHSSLPAEGTLATPMASAATLRRAQGELEHHGTEPTP